MTYNANDEAFAEGCPRLSVVPRRDDGEDVEHDKRADGGDEVDWTATELVYKKGEKEILAQRQRLHAAVDAELRLGIRQANVVHDVFEII